METPCRFVRFVLPVCDEDASCATRVFQVRTLWRTRDVSPAVDRRVRSAFAWFGDNLPVPPVVKSQRVGLCWFRREPGEPWRPDAHEPLRRAFQLASYLRSRGIRVETLQSSDAGRVLYQDRWQIVAVPCEATPSRWDRRGSIWRSA
jgi:hypothetical protein